MGSQHPPEESQGHPLDGQEEPIKDVELLRVLVVREGHQVNTQWSIHPQLKHDLKSEEWKEVTELMGKVTGIVGTRFSQVLSAAEPDQAGNA